VKVRSEGVGEEVQTPTFLHVPPVGYMCKTDEKFWVTPKYTQSSASTKLLIAVKMHQNLQIGTSYFKKKPSVGKYPHPMLGRGFVVSPRPNPITLPL